jgi:hypothetical protein
MVRTTSGRLTAPYRISMLIRRTPGRHAPRHDYCQLIPIDRHYGEVANANPRTIIQGTSTYVDAEIRLVWADSSSAKASLEVVRTSRR